MYAVNEACQKALKGRTREIDWNGTITLADGSETIQFDSSNIVEGTGTISRVCSSQSSIDLGGVYASELQISLRLNIDRYKLQDAKINLYSRVYYPQTVSTWEEAAKFTWGEWDSTLWGDKERRLHEDIPMGVFTVSEVLRAIDIIQITAYDDMLKFDKTLLLAGVAARTPYEWLKWLCSACDVTLGETSKEIAGLPNGTMSLLFMNVNEQATTYRDLLSHLTTVLASTAMINRQGELVLKQYGMTPADTIGTSVRYSSNFSDYQSYYTGLSASYKAKSLQEYYKNSDKDDGLIYDVGFNVFLQIESDTSRKKACQAIIDSLIENKYVPFNVSMPFNPVYDLMDIVTFEGNQASSNDIAPLTAITIKINDKMTIQCFGENPKLLGAQSRESKAINGLNNLFSSGMSGKKIHDFWLFDDYLQKSIEVESTAKQVCLAAFKLQTDKGRGVINYTMTYSMAEAGNVKITVYLDDTAIYEAMEYKTEGSAISTVTTPFEVYSANQVNHEMRIDVQTV